MSDVLLLLGPSTSKYDVEFVEQYEQSRIQIALNDLETYHKVNFLIFFYSFFFIETITYCFGNGYY